MQASKYPVEMLNKVPEVTILFWIIKVMATTVGETGADFLIFNLKFGLAMTSYLTSAMLIIILLLQITTKKYIPWLYWITVVLISIVGTLITDNLVDNLGVKLELTTFLFGFSLMLTFIFWYISEKTLSIHTIYTVKREVFYWSAILFTFALGTAAGDLVAENWHFGYAVSGLIFAAVIGIVTISYYSFKRNAILAFWIAYIMTRPLGASFGDYLSQPVTNGGLGLGTINTSIAFLLIILGLVSYLSLNKKAISMTKNQT